MRWEYRVTTMRALLCVEVLTVLPLLSSLLGKELLRPSIQGLDRLLESRLYREITGFTALALVLLAMTLILSKRTRLPLPYSRRQARGLHVLIGLGPLLVILLHTGGHWGSNVNGVLLGALLLTVSIAVVGKLVENHRVEQPGENGSAQRVRSIWLHAHLIAVAVLLVLLPLHIFLAYYF
jgi:nitrite reductase (NADH) large subunit